MRTRNGKALNRSEHLYTYVISGFAELVGRSCPTPPLHRAQFVIRTTEVHDGFPAQDNGYVPFMTGHTGLFHLGDLRRLASWERQRCTRWQQATMGYVAFGMVLIDDAILHHGRGNWQGVLALVDWQLAIICCSGVESSLRRRRPFIPWDWEKRLPCLRVEAFQHRI